MTSSHAWLSQILKELCGECHLFDIEYDDGGYETATAGSESEDGYGETKQGARSPIPPPPAQFPAMQQLTFHVPPTAPMPGTVGGDDNVGGRGALLCPPAIVCFPLSDDIAGAISLIRSDLSSSDDTVAVVGDFVDFEVNPLALNLEANRILYNIASLVENQLCADKIHVLLFLHSQDSTVFFPLTPLILRLKKWKQTLGDNPVSLSAIRLAWLPLLFGNVFRRLTDIDVLLSNFARFKSLLRRKGYIVLRLEEIFFCMTATMAMLDRSYLEHWDRPDKMFLLAMVNGVWEQKQTYNPLHSPFLHLLEPGYQGKPMPMLQQLYSARKSLSKNIDELMKAIHLSLLHSNRASRRKKLPRGEWGELNHALSPLYSLSYYQHVIFPVAGNLQCKKTVCVHTPTRRQFTSISLPMLLESVGWMAHVNFVDASTMVFDPSENQKRVFGVPVFDRDDYTRPNDFEEATVYSRWACLPAPRMIQNVKNMLLVAGETPSLTKMLWASLDVNLPIAYIEIRRIERGGRNFFAVTEWSCMTGFSRVFKYLTLFQALERLPAASELIVSRPKYPSDMIFHVFQGRLQRNDTSMTLSVPSSVELAAMAHPFAQVAVSYRWDVKTVASDLNLNQHVFLDNEKQFQAIRHIGREAMDIEYVTELQGLTEINERFRYEVVEKLQGFRCKLFNVHWPLAINASIGQANMKVWRMLGVSTDQFTKALGALSAAYYSTKSYLFSSIEEVMTRLDSVIVHVVLEPIFGKFVSRIDAIVSTYFPLCEDFSCREHLYTDNMKSAMLNIALTRTILGDIGYCSLVMIHRIANGDVDTIIKDVINNVIRNGNEAMDGATGYIKYACRYYRSVCMFSVASAIAQLSYTGCGRVPIPNVHDTPQGTVHHAIRWNAKAFAEKVDYMKQSIRVEMSESRTVLIQLKDVDSSSYETPLIINGDIPWVLMFNPAKFVSLSHAIKYVISQHMVSGTASDLTWKQCVHSDFQIFGSKDNNWDQAFIGKSIETAFADRNFSPELFPVLAALYFRASQMTPELSAILAKDDGAVALPIPSIISGTLDGFPKEVLAVVNVKLQENWQSILK